MGIHNLLNRALKTVIDNSGITDSFNVPDNHNRRKYYHNSLLFHLLLRFRILHISSLADF